MKAKNPDLVYFGGIYHQGGLLLKQMREKGVNAAFMGPDGLDSSEMVKIAGSQVVVVAIHHGRRTARSLPGVRRFRHEIQAALRQGSRVLRHVRLRRSSGRHQSHRTNPTNERREETESR